MIDKVLEALQVELSNYLAIVAGLEEAAIDKIKISHLFNSGGEAIPSEIGITLVNIEEDRVNKANDPYIKNSTGLHKVNPEIKLNVFVLFSANFVDNYDEALKFISYIIRFFQSKHVFTSSNTPRLDPSIEKIIAELHPMSFEQQNYLWGMIGGKYLPSVMYKLKMLVIQEDVGLERVERITIVKNVNGK
ncbi:MAG: DUF4255 domain-containing protein [Bacteroidetes bacterium]|nr:DUF4255 domain-containing protein [Bacteroidota bacterium]